MLSKVCRTTAFQRSVASQALKRQMSSQIAIQEEVQNHHLTKKQYISMRDLSDKVTQGEKDLAAERKQYHDMLNDVDARQRFF